MEIIDWFFFFKKKGLAISLLLGSQKSIITFLQRPPEKETEDAKAILLEFLAKFIEIYPKDTNEYHIKIKVFTDLFIYLFIFLKIIIANLCEFIWKRKSK